LLIDALDRFSKETAGNSQLFAVDVGCGDGTDTLFLLEKGWQVMALDGEPAAIELIQSKVPARHEDRLQAHVISFQDLELPPVDLVYASLSLPFCPPNHFEAMWAEIMGAIRTGGRFAGQLFGVRDSWASNQNWTFHTSDQVTRLFSSFEVELLHEIDEDGEATSGPKHWHVFDIIARKTK
jgi:trans-aconitate methyltransferase